MVEQGNEVPNPQIQAFLAMLRQQPGETDCRLCLSQLHDYVVTQQAGEDIQRQFAWTRQHLDSCVACAEAYGRLYEMILAEEQNQLAQPEHVPAPDLSFLAVTPHLPTLLGQAIQQRGQRLTLQLNQLLTGLLVPSPQAALTRSTGQGRYSQKLLELMPDQLPDAPLPLTLTAFADEEQSGRCLVEVTVEPPGISWPDLAGRKVILTVEASAQTAETDEWGTAVFPNILIQDLDTLRLDVYLDTK